MKTSTTTKILIFNVFILNLIVHVSSVKRVEDNGLVSEIVDVQIRRSRTIDEDDYYDINYRAFEEDISVRVRRDEPSKEDTSLYARSFKVTTLDMDPSGSTLFADETPSRKEVLERESKIYVDPHSDTAVQIKKDANGNVTLKGIVQGRTIMPTVESGDENGVTAHKVVELKVPKLSDFIDVHRKTKPLKGRSLFKGIPMIEPEVFVVLDFDNSMLHNGDVKAIMDYLTVLFKAVNNRFATLKDIMIIKFKISGLITIKSYNAQPFIENWSVLNGKGHDIIKVLDAFSKWLYNYQTKVPPHDLAALITGKEMYTLDQGIYKEGVTGYAYVKGACWVNEREKKYMGTSVTEDIGGYWYGVFSIAHEFAHNLGAPHDGQPGGGPFNEPSTADCPWEQGYMMSYVGWGNATKFYFSKCSARLMKEFLISTGASCMTFKHAKSQWKESNKEVGDKLSMKAMCVKFTKNPKAYVDPDRTPDELCKNLVCRMPGATPNKFNFMILNHSPGDYTLCAPGKRCVNGDCIAVNRRAGAAGAHAEGAQAQGG